MNGFQSQCGLPTTTASINIAAEHQDWFLLAHQLLQHADLYIPGGIMV